MVAIIIGVLLILAAVATLVVSIVRTPENLRGFYGVTYYIFFAVVAVGSIALIVLGALGQTAA